MGNHTLQFQMFVILDPISETQLTTRTDPPSIFLVGIKVQFEFIRIVGYVGAMGAAALAPEAGVVYLIYPR
jgi:hypothetical protein